jgi:hypothetical protein
MMKMMMHIAYFKATLQQKLKLMFYDNNYYRKKKHLF